MSCPACSKPMPQHVRFTCPDCWARIPAKDRQQLFNMLRREQPTASKLASVVRKLKEAR